MDMQPILLALGGSRAYGTHNPESDVDLRGVVIPPREYYTGLRTFEQTSQNPLEARYPKADCVIYELRKFLGLAMNMNPVAVDLLFCRDEDVIITSPLGQQLREARGLFVSARVLYSFGGFARGILAQSRHELSSDWPDADGSRARRRDKRVATMVRLLTMRREILEIGAVRVYREDDAERLRAIRAGREDIEELLAWAEEEFEAQAQLVPVVPTQPDEEAINALCMDLVDQALKNGS